MPLSAFKFRPRLTEFEHRLTLSTVVEDFVYTLPPSSTPPATTDNDDMGSVWGDDTTNDDMGVSGGPDTTNDDMGVSGDDGGSDIANVGASGAPIKVIGAPPTGYTPPAGSTIIGGPGRLQYPPRSIAIVIEDSVSGDAASIRSRTSDDSRVVDHVTSWNQVRQEIAKAPAGSLGSLIISGHGVAEGGVRGVNVEVGDQTYVLYTDDIDPETMAAIKSRLAPGAPLILSGCSCGQSAAALQDLANRTGHPVIANTGSMSSCNLGSGDWVRFDPQR